MPTSTPSPASVDPDHPPDAAAPIPVTSPADRGRFAVLTGGTLVAASGIVLAVSALLPVLAAWVLPLLLTVLTAAFVVLGRRAARSGATAPARAWAAWAGVCASVATGGWVNLAGFGGALVAVLLVVIALNVVIALWFRSPVHFAVAQALGVAWGALAHVYGVVPLATLVLGIAGLWWCRTVGVHRVVVVATTITLPVAVTLVLHPLTHPGPGIDGADVAVLTGAVAVAVTGSAVVGGARPVSTLWSTLRATAVVVLVVQVVAGAVPPVATALAPAAPWPSVLAAVAAVLASAVVVVVRTTRAGTWTVLVLAAVQLAELAAAVLSGSVGATVVGLGGLLAVVVVTLVRGAPGVGVRPLLWVAVLMLPTVAAVLVGAPLPVVAVVLVLVGTTVAVLQTGRAR